MCKVDYGDLITECPLPVAVFTFTSAQAAKDRTLSTHFIERISVILLLKLHLNMNYIKCRIAKSKALQKSMGNWKLEWPPHWKGKQGTSVEWYGTVGERGR
jgi:hypothetical protein